MPVFPSGAPTTPAPPGAGYSLIPRSIGTVALNDGQNTWCNPPEIPYARMGVYDKLINRSGAVARTRRDYNPAIIIITGYWIDGGGRKWTDFLTSLEAVNQAELKLGDGTAYASVDVIDCAGKFVAPVGFDTGAGIPLQCWSWSIKCQAYSALRVIA